MNLDDSHAALVQRAAELREASEHANQPLINAAREVAQHVKDVAKRRGHSISIRVIERPRGVRLTITGPYANRYREMSRQELERRVPQAVAEIRTLLTKKAR